VPIVLGRGQRRGPPGRHGNSVRGRPPSGMEAWNYFNYFTEIEEYFWKKRGAHLLVSPVDWALMEAWQKAGIPLEAVLKGIDRAFESYAKSRRGSGKTLKSLAYCSDAVLEAAEQQAEAAAGSMPKQDRARTEPFSREDLRAYFSRNLERLTTARSREKAGSPLGDQIGAIEKSLQAIINTLATAGALDLEDLECQLTVLDDKLHAALLTHARDELLVAIRRSMDSQLAAYRRKMRAPQLALVEKQYMQRRLLEEFGLPRLSLYYFS
jgi:hypothetical protein